MLSMKRKKSVVGLDIGSKATKIVQISFNGTAKPTLDRCDLIPSGTADAEFEGNIKAYLKQNKIGNALVASSIDDNSLKIRKMELPVMPELDLLEAIRWNLRDVVDGNIDDYTVSFSKIIEIEDGDSKKIELTAYAINKNAVLDLQVKIQSLGLQPYFIEPAAVTLATTLERCHGEDAGNAYIAGVHIGNNQSLFYVVGKGVFVFSRPLLGIGLEAQEKDPPGFNQKLAIEIQKSIDTFKVNFKMEEIQSIHLSGGGALVGEVRDYLTTNMGIKTDVLNPMTLFANAESFSNVSPPLFAQAVALAYVQA